MLFALITLTNERVWGIRKLKNFCYEKKVENMGQYILTERKISLNEDFDVLEQTLNHFLQTPIDLHVIRQHIALKHLLRYK